MAESERAADAAWARARQRRRRARRAMQALTLLCALAAAGIGGEQFYTGGLRAFLDRPPGVGATPPTPPATGPAATASAGNPATAAH